jgi:hypothetical protein
MPVRAEALREPQGEFETRMGTLARVEVDNDTFVAHCLTPVAGRHETPFAFDSLLL